MWLVGGPVCVEVRIISKLFLHSKSDNGIICENEKR